MKKELAMIMVIACDSIHSGRGNASDDAGGGLFKTLRNTRFRFRASSFMLCSCQTSAGESQQLAKTTTKLTKPSQNFSGLSLHDLERTCFFSFFACPVELKPSALNLLTLSPITPHPKPQTLNPKPQTLGPNPKL